MWHHVSWGHQHKPAAALQCVSIGNIRRLPQVDLFFMQLRGISRMPRALISERVWRGGTRPWACSEHPHHRSVCILNFVNLCSYCCPQSRQDRPWKPCVSYFFVKGKMSTQWSSIYTMEHPMVGTWRAFPETQVASGCRWLIYGRLGLTWWNTAAAAPWWGQRK